MKKVIFSIISAVFIFNGSFAQVLQYPKVEKVDQTDEYFGTTPFAVGIVELNDNVKVTTQIADVNFDQLKIGQKVKLVFRKIQDEGKSGLHCYGYKAILI